MTSTQQHILVILASGAEQATAIQARLIAEHRRELGLPDVYQALVGLYDRGLVELVPRKRGRDDAHLNWARTQGVPA